MAAPTGAAIRFSGAAKRLGYVWLLRDILVMLRCVLKGYALDDAGRRWHMHAARGAHVALSVKGGSAKRARRAEGAHPFGALPTVVAAIAWHVLSSARALQSDILKFCSRPENALRSAQDDEEWSTTCRAPFGLHCTKARSGKFSSLHAFDLVKAAV